MPQIIKKACYTLLFLSLILLILTNAPLSLSLASRGLLLWFEKMIPTLLPFMILSGLMVRLRLTEGFASLLHPFLAPFWKVRKNVTYAMFMGFLCGFPMGAKVTCDLLKRRMITEKEGEFLLAFCNNIGPVYFVSFVLPLLHRKLLWPYLFGMYGLPFFYGLGLRHTVYRSLYIGQTDFSKKEEIISRTQGQILLKAKKQIPLGAKEQASNTIRAHQAELTNCEKKTPLSLLEQIDDSIQAALQSTLMLGGYMILFNLLNVLPIALARAGAAAGLNRSFSLLPAIAAPVLEITGGLGLLGDRMPLLTLLLLPFGGLSCIAQTYSTIKGTDLSLSNYVKHKLILTGITALYYGAWALLSPATFLK